MSFHDLPADWAQRSITDPGIFTDAVDLFASDEGRRAGSLLFLWCHPDGRALLPTAVDGWDFDAPAAAQRELFDRLVGLLGRDTPGHVVLVVSRRGVLRVSGNDRQTLHTLATAAAAHGIEVLAVAIATPHGVMRCPDHVAGRAA